MKMYSSEVVTKEQVTQVATETATAAASAVDRKQSEQISKLRVLLAVSFAVNLIVALGAYFIKL
jgi:hypothetical protein